MLTVTYKQFKDQTERSFPRYRSSYQDRVLEALKSYQATPSRIALIALRGALRAWKSNKPTEFANRDALSLQRGRAAVDAGFASGMCTRLMVEVGLSPLHIDTLEVDPYAYMIYLPFAKRAAYVDRLPFSMTVTDVGIVYTRLQRSVAQALRDNADEACVVLIDMEGPNGDPRPDLAANHGFHARFDELSVLEHQIEVLKAAAVFGVPVFDVTTSGAQQQTVKELTSLFDHLDVLHYKKRANNPFNTGPGHGALRGTRSLEQDLRDSQRTVAVVMGYHANQCVNSTIFGTPSLPSLPQLKMKGLLQIGFKVITSRNVVASDGNASLQAEYGPMAA